jgi:hypothetical protein
MQPINKDELKYQLYNTKRQIPTYFSRCKVAPPQLSLATKKK